MQQFRLRYRAHDIELPPGEFVIGRSEDCQLSIDDPMVSRRHAMFCVTGNSVILVDLGSRNGVAVNGDKISGERPMIDGDRITIGKHELLFCIVQPDSQRSRGFLARTLGPIELAKLESAVGGGKGPSTGTARVVASFTTLAQLADKALALGRPEDAERILNGPYAELMKEMGKGALVDTIVLGRFATYALRLATDLQKSMWIEWILEAYSLQKMLLPAPIIDELFNVAPKLKHLGQKPFFDYVNTMSESTLTANERFLLQRLEGLARHLT
ncbi:MAG: FHA domain-containing protein [Polyangiaceae bacterium]|nr:FHA domain-containing protein [Polyangiaceae bacterium]